MKVKMLQEVNGKVDGVLMGPYHLGREYELDNKRAELFIGSAMAEKVIPPPVKKDRKSEPVATPKQKGRGKAK